MKVIQVNLFSYWLMNNYSYQCINVKVVFVQLLYKIGYYYILYKWYVVLIG